MSAAACADHRMDLIDDHHARGPEHLPAPFRSEQQIERLRRRHQDVGWRPEHRRALRLRGVARAHCRRDPRRLESHLLGDVADSFPRFR